MARAQRAYLATPMRAFLGTHGILKGYDRRVALLPERRDGGHDLIGRQAKLGAGDLRGKVLLDAGAAGPAEAKESAGYPGASDGKLIGMQATERHA